MDKVKLLAESIRGLPGIAGVARENMPPMGLDHNFFGIQYQTQSGGPIPVMAIKADQNFIPLYAIRLIAGSNLHSSDTLKEL